MVKALTKARPHRWWAASLGDVSRGAARCGHPDRQEGSRRRVLGMDVPQTHSRNALDASGRRNLSAAPLPAVLRRRFGVCGRCPWLSVHQPRKCPRPRTYRGQRRCSDADPVVFAQLDGYVTRCEERSVKPSAQPTLVRTQHLPPVSAGQSWWRGIASPGFACRASGSADRSLWFVGHAWARSGAPQPLGASD